MPVQLWVIQRRSQRGWFHNFSKMSSPWPRCQIRSRWSELWSASTRNLRMSASEAAKQKSIKFKSQTFQGYLFFNFRKVDPEQEKMIDYIDKVMSVPSCAQNQSDSKISMLKNWISISKSNSKNLGSNNIKVVTHGVKGSRSAKSERIRKKRQNQPEEVGSNKLTSGWWCRI